MKQVDSEYDSDGFQDDEPEQLPCTKRKRVIDGKGWASDNYPFSSKIAMEKRFKVDRASDALSQTLRYQSIKTTIGVKWRRNSRAAGAFFEHMSAAVSRFSEIVYWSSVLANLLPNMDTDPTLEDGSNNPKGIKVGRLAAILIQIIREEGCEKTSLEKLEGDKMSGSGRDYHPSMAVVTQVTDLVKEIMSVVPVEAANVLDNMEGMKSRWVSFMPLMHHMLMKFEARSTPKLLDDLQRAVDSIRQCIADGTYTESRYLDPRGFRVYTLLPIHHPRTYHLPVSTNTLARFLSKVGGMPNGIEFSPNKENYTPEERSRMWSVPFILDQEHFEPLPELANDVIQMKWYFDCWMSTDGVSGSWRFVQRKDINLKDLDKPLSVTNSDNVLKRQLVERDCASVTVLDPGRTDVFSGFNLAPVNLEPEIGGSGAVKLERRRCQRRRKSGKIKKMPLNLQKPNARDDGPGDYEGFTGTPWEVIPRHYLDQRSAEKSGMRELGIIAVRGFAEEVA
ncbi:hypothetical protein BC829DRAFT_421071 [Chytridium lagenaria]|nr:hypothetical protein BC829DRAFT_421071 [Chytridium lagenaria]